MTDMVQLVNIHPPRPFEYSDGSRETAAARWKVWVRELNVFFAACNVVNEKQKLHVLLNQAPDLQEIYYAKWEDKTKYEEVVKLFEGYFAPQSNKNHARYVFGFMAQGDVNHVGETIDDFATRLRLAARVCDFETDDVESELKRQLLRGTTCELLRKELLAAGDDETMDVAIKKTREKLTIERQSKVTVAMGPTVKSEPISAVGSRPTRKGEWGNGKRAGDGVCTRCGREYPHTNRPCPAEGKKCRECGGMNHFAWTMGCPKKRGGINNVQSGGQDSSSEDDDQKLIRRYVF